MPRSAIVVGGGIGGLAAALGLLRNGWRVEVFEQASEFQPVGAGLAVAPNAVRAFDWLGLGAQLRSKGMAQGPAGIRTATGRWLMRARLEQLQRQFGEPAFALHRADIHDMLLTALTDARLHTGHQVTTVHSEPGSATITYRASGRGTGTASADLVVAADGVHSRLRAALFPDHPGPAYAGYITWRGIVPARAAVQIKVDAAVTETWGRGMRFGVAPLPDGRIYWFATLSAPEGSHARDQIAELRTRYRGWHAPIPHVLHATPDDSLLRHDIYSLPPLPTFMSGRVALLGDAAHAITPDLGQGACLALEDAVTLAAHVAQHDDLAAALAAYDRARRSRTQNLVNMSARAGQVAQWSNPAAVAVRNALAQAVPTAVYLRSVSDTFSWSPRTEGVPPGCDRRKSM